MAVWKLDTLQGKKFWVTLRKVQFRKLAYVRVE